MEVAVPPLAVLTLNVVRGVGRRWWGQVSDIPTLGQELLGLLGSPQTGDELRSLLPPIGFCRRLNKTK